MQQAPHAFSGTTVLLLKFNHKEEDQDGPDHGVMNMPPPPPDSPLPIPTVLCCVVTRCL